MTIRSAAAGALVDVSAAQKIVETAMIRMRWKCTAPPLLLIVNAARAAALRGVKAPFGLLRLSAPSTRPRS